MRLKQGTYTLEQKTQTAYELKDVQRDIHRGVGLAVCGGRFLLLCRAPAGAKSMTCFWGLPVCIVLHLVGAHQN